MVEFVSGLENSQIHFKKANLKSKVSKILFGVLTKFRTSNEENGINNDFFNHLSFLLFSKLASSEK